MNNTYIRNNGDFIYRVELAACNIAIQTLGQFSSMRTWIQRGVSAFSEHSFPLWVAGIALSGIVGMLSGFFFYCFLAFTR
jgi:hypothetical protein